ncbi:DUF2809 domain-containing protein [Jonesiaceae bacterium BS-20]|uniref:DUF2809 domain-containing protein n=1 Tax=Jonesiaceae bacterium BS-20 TaxID=3120821 RepID=A0AAU7DX11_9MICO
MTTSGQLGVPERNRTRLVLLGCALAVILAGLLIRFGVPRLSASPLAGLLGDLGGSVLYAALWVILIRFVRPTMQRMPVALWAFGISAAIELLQLTAFPSLAVQKFAPLALLLGSTFNPLDLVGYALGAVLGVLLFGTIGAQKNRT